MRCVLPYPPSSNRYWRFPKFLGYPILSREARDYKRNAALDAKSQGVRVMAGPIALTIHVYRPRKSGDLGNRLKIAEDALNGVAWTDDKQVEELHMFLRDDKLKPRLEVTVESAKRGDEECPTSVK